MAHWKNHKVTCASNAALKSMSSAMRMDSRKVSTLSHQLGFASYRGDLSLCRRLLGEGANCTTYADPNDGATALYAASSGFGFGEVKGQHLAVMKLLLQHGAPVNKAKINGIMDTPLHGAAGALHLDRVKLLVASGADVHARCRAGTPLDMATHEEVKALLREHGGKLTLFGERVQVCVLLL